MDQTECDLSRAHLVTRNIVVNFCFNYNWTLMSMKQQDAAFLKLINGAVSIVSFAKASHEAPRLYVTH